MTATRQQLDGSGFQQRLIVHYSRIAGWLETTPWYRDNKVADAVCFLFPPNPSRVLELCCGSGLLLETLSNVFPRAEFIGIDISPGMVRRACERLARCSNVLTLEQDWVYGLGSEWERAFDVIVIKNALHVLDNLVTRLKDLRRVSRSLTTLIVVETVSPNADANEFIKYLFRFADPEHVKQTFFTERILTSVLREAGWHVAKQYVATHVRQHIDTESWLGQKCADRAALESARKLLSGAPMCVRQALDFDTDPGVVPTYLLRLQYISRYVLTATEVKPELRTDDSIQLQLF